MTEPMESRTNAPGTDNAEIVKWLRYLLIIQAIGLAATVLGTMVPLTLVSWAGKGVTLATAVVLFRLAPANPRYKTAAQLQAVILIGGIIAAVFGSLLLSLMNLVTGICQIVAEYQEYTGHGELIESRDGKLAGRWRALFIWKLVIELFGGVLAVFGAVIGIMMEYAAQTVLTVVLVTTVAVTSVLKILYLVFLNRTRELLDEG